MVDLQVLDAFGSSQARLKEVLTAVPLTGPVPTGKEERKAYNALKKQRDKDVANRENIRRMSQTRIEEGIVLSIKNWKKYAAVDLAWDSTVVNGMTLPLLMYAQGKINVERACEFLSKTERGNDYIKTTDEGGIKKQELDLPRFVETEVNLIRSVITRRHGAQKVKYDEIWPHYKYEARSTGVVDKCRADVLSQRMDMMADQFGYKEHEDQVLRDAFLYAESVDFIRARWEIEKQYRLRPEKTVDSGKLRVESPGQAPVLPEGGDIKLPDGMELETVITREGVGWWRPHRSRLFYDNSHPLNSINTDTGCQWLGYWDVYRYSWVDNNPDFFNKDKIGWTGKFWGEGGFYNNYRDYFTHYQYTIVPPATGEVDPSRLNDRTAIVGYYSGNRQDASVFVANYFWKMVPKDWGIGEYPWPVWVRLVQASDMTSVYGEFLPSTPAAYLGININDSRQTNVSMAMELFAYQQQMTNLLTHLMLLCQAEQFKAFGINTDVFKDKAGDVAAIRAHMRGINWATEPLVYEYSASTLQELGIDPKLAAQVFSISETRMGQSINVIFEAMARLVELVEKLFALSPNEQGQPNPREVTATETNQIAGTTSAVYGSISADADRYRAAKKRICYESTVACHEGKIECPVKDRYTSKTILAAGFTPREGADEDFSGDSKRRTVIGSRTALVGEYIFTSRDGAERPVNAQGANTLTQLIGFLMNMPAVAQGMGKRKLYELVNEAVRMSGAGVDLNLEVKEGEDDSLGADEMQQLSQTVQGLQKALQQLAGQAKQMATDLDQQKQVNAEQQQMLEHVNTLAGQVQKTSKDVSEIQQRGEGVNKKLIESMAYKDVPDPIKRQIEAEAGFVPAHGEQAPPEKIAAMRTPAKKAA